ncbi:E6 [Chelonia mydas papillomavirus 1]|uniref:E6 n=1 Tax=Chelonia mydas papillomavirus 1 TaxID=485242 RepID=B6RUP1_9PAPI|nr:E6 [Chelonia mydas papillomavirus 1]QJX58433.1 E6 [Chelonia mydas papillomavirus 1]QJX58440.1 E6 [Chelonia mydas papillomavirus 1]
MPPRSVSPLLKAIQRFPKLLLLCHKLRVTIFELKIACLYCRKSLDEIEIVQLLEEGAPFGISRGVKGPRRCYAACAKCRLFVDNA